jgi:PAS domain S-box-containing protein
MPGYLSLPRQIIDLIDSATAILDLDGRLLHLNPAAERLLGGSVETLQGGWPASALAGGSGVGAGSPTTLATQGGDGSIGVFRLRRPDDGQLVPVEISTRLVPVPDGGAPFVLANIHHLDTPVELLNAAALAMIEEPGEDLLAKIIRFARDLVGARYAALGVWEDGQLVRFIPDGMSEEQIAGIEHPPVGVGLLGATIAERRTLRLAAIDDDPRRSGFPAGHPPMHALLSTPIRTGDVVYGILYLTDKEGAPGFSFLDERLVELLASQAAVAIRTDRQRRAVEASERNLAEAQRVARLGSWDWDLLTDVLNWSDEHCRIYGIEPRAFGGTNSDFLVFVHPDDLPRVREADRRTQAEGAPYDLDFRIFRSDGAVRVVHEFGEVIRDETGRPARVVGTTQDITEQAAMDRERARLYEELHQSQRILAEAQRLAHIGSWEWDITRNVHRWSDECHRIFGLEPGSFIGTNGEFLELVHPDDRARAAEADRAALADGSPYLITHRIIRPNGEIRLVREIGEVVRDDNGDPVTMVGTTQDITEQTAGEMERIQLYSELKRSERNLAEAQRVARLGSWEWDFKTDVLTESDEACRILGIEPGTFGGSAEVLRSQFMHPDDRDRVHDADQASIEEGASPVFDYRIIRPDGAIRIIHEAGQVIRDDDGTPLRMVGTIQDITEQVAAEEERNRLEEQLRRSENSLAEAQRIAHVGSWEWDAATDVLEASDEMCRILGIDPAAFGRTNDAFMAFVHPDDRAATDVAERAVLEGRIPHSFDYRIIRPDGEVRTLHEVGDVIRDAAGNPIRMVGTARDITEQVAAEEERARLISAVEQTADSIFIQDLDGMILYVNPAFSRLYGYPPEEVVGRHAGLLDSGYHDPAFWATLWASVAAGTDWSGRIVNRRRDGTLIETEAVISGIRDRSGRVTSFLQTDRDITRERELEEQLRQAQKMEAIGQLAGGIAHDFNNLLTAIRGYGELARDPAASDEQRRADLDEIIANVDRATELTGQLLAFGRRTLLRPEVADPIAIVGGIVPLLRRLIGEHIRIETAMAPDVGPIRVDRSQLEQVIVNLAINARDAMPDGGTLAIAIAPVDLDAAAAASIPEAVPGAYVQLTVADTGSGMDEATRARIFEPFFTTKAVGEGTGLGLAGVYGVIRQSGGAITVESAPGRGTTFRILLPTAEAEAAMPAPSRATAAARGGAETILLVEDETAVRVLSRRLLDDHGYTVLEAADGVSAVRLASEHPGPIELLLTDVVMPSLTGPDVARLIAETRPAIRVLFVSGYVASALESPSFGVGAYLAKPFTAEALLRKVRETLDGPAAG